MYRKLVFKVLSRMKKGKLIMELPDGEVIEWGDGIGFSASLKVNDHSLWKRIVLYGDIGFAEGYMDKQWDTTDLTAVIRWFILNIDQTPGASGSSARGFLFNMLQGVNRLWHIARSNTPGGSKKNIQAHYDLSNDFFSLFLDPTMTYSSGLFLLEDDNLEQAQFNKYDSLCREAGVKEGDHILEIGTGWGGFAVFAARQYGAQVTTVTISEAQYAFATERVRNEGLEDKVSILLKDYRDITGTFDKVVSIEMIEAVGAAFLPVYFQKIHQVLKPEGVLALQAIVCPDSRFDEMKRKVDFIQKHIFPGSLLPSVAAINSSINETGDLFLFTAKDLGKSYVRTLAQWRTSFNKQVGKVKGLGFNEQFVRKWNYYFSYCEAAFDMRNINVLQLIYTRPNNFGFKDEHILV